MSQPLLGVHPTRVAVLAIWSTLVPFLVAGAAAQTPEPKRVLAFYWYAKDTPSNVAFEGYLQAALKREPAGTIEYYSEYIESNRFPGEAQARLLRDYLRQKYADREIDVLLAMSPVPIEFLLKYRSDLFPDTPIVFYSGVALEAVNPNSERLLTGVLNTDSYVKTLELALRLHPETTQAFIISGTPARDRILEREARAELQRYEERMALTYLTDLPLDQLIATVKGIPERSIILYSRQSQDDPGRVLFPTDFLTLISRSAPVPVYDPWRSHLGFGSVGGDVDDMEAGATKAAEMILKIAKGARPEDIPFVPLPKIPMFDARQLVRWEIGEARLPPASIVLFREPTLWSQYWGYLVAAALVLVVQAALIGGLLVQRARRRDAEAGLERTRQELARVARVTTLAEFAASIAHEVSQPLTAILANAQACLRWLRGAPPGDDLRDALVEIADAARLANDVMVRNRELFRRGTVEKQPLGINDVVRDVAALARVRLHHSDVRLETTLDEGLPAVLGDRIELQQVLLNLLLNSIEAMESVDSRSRRLHVRTHRASEEHVQVTVRDTGIGLAGVDVDRMFTAFYTTKPGGTGIGLSISRSIVEAHGGRFWAQPGDSQGATFCFTVPVADADALRPAPARRESEAEGALTR